MAISAIPLNTKAPQSIEQIVREGRLTVGMELAYRILSEANYERQRPISRSHIQLLAETMRRGNWMPGGQIAFGVLDGRLHLINGQHRLNAVVEAERDCEFQVVLLPVDTPEALHSLYYRFDTEQRARSLPEILTAVGFPDKHGLSKTMARTAFDAALLIALGFQNVRSADNPSLTRSRDVRLEIAAPWGAYAKEYERLIAPAPTIIRQRLLNAQVAAVAFVTLKHQAIAAEHFWGGLAQNDGLRRGDPRHTLLLDLPTRAMAAGRLLVGSLIAANAWNAHFKHITLSQLRVSANQTVRILGTPYDGRAR